MISKDELLKFRKGFRASLPIIPLSKRETEIVLELIQFKLTPFSFDPDHVETCIDFVHHIQDHFREDRERFPIGTEVMCKICNKTLTQIHSEIEHEDEPNV